MNWDIVIAVSELIGVIVIIASLAYVGVQIRQNTSIARANIIHATNSVSVRMAELIVQDAEVAEIFEKGTNGVSLTGTDLVRFCALIEMHLTWLEDVDSQFEADLFFDDEEVKDLVGHMSGELAMYFTTPEARQWWQDNRSVYRPSFVRKVDKHIGEP